MDHHDAGPGTITVFLADDNLIVREGVRALINRHPDLEAVGVAEDYDGVVNGATATSPQVLVTDIRMPPAFQREGIDAANEVRKRHPGTGIVVLSQHEDPEYAVSLLAEGPADPGPASNSTSRMGGVCLRARPRLPYAAYARPSRRRTRRSAPCAVWT
jgi:DNA-binding NarL/FixJ family response regulator